MSTTGTTSSVATARRRDQLRADPTCADCGHTDAGGDWAAVADAGGRRTVFRHVCPRCGAAEERTFRTPDA